MARIVGGCLCGAVRYESDVEPAMVAVCHCTSCQRSSGSAFSLNVGLSEDAVRFSGESLATYEDRSGSSGKPFKRRFCARCGSSIVAHGEAYPGLVFLKAGTLDNPSWVEPEVHIWCADKQPWVAIDEDVARLPGNPG